MNDDELTAIHDAGHAVARERLHIINDSITIEPDHEAGTAGRRRARD